MVNLPTKFEVSSFTRYEDMKTVKMHKMGCFGVVRGHRRLSAVDAYDFLFVLIETMHLSCTVFKIW